MTPGSDVNQIRLPGTLELSEERERRRVHAVIAENDVSVWADETGAVYHFPKRYGATLATGTLVLYYKGRMTDQKFFEGRLSREPHYFGMARIGKVLPDRNSSKGDLFAIIEDYRPFDSAVLAKIDGQYLEAIPASKASNYWRSGVRPIQRAVFDNIMGRARLMPAATPGNEPSGDAQDFQSRVEGDPYSYFGVKYERDRALRLQAIAIHGLVCKACNFDFFAAYGEYAKGFIHVHHTQPISEYGSSRNVDPERDLVTLCANCHAVVHHKRKTTLSLVELKAMLKGRWVLDDQA